MAKALRLALMAAPAMAKAPIEHVVLLFMENRPFDHYFGLADLPGADGLSGHECNWYDVKDHSKGQVCVKDKRANYICNNGPSQAFSVFHEAIYGPGVWNGSGAPYPAPEKVYGTGFLEAEDGNEETMYPFHPDQLPVKMALAKEFAVFDQWYSSFPGPSTPNHLFLHSATSMGCTTTDAPYQCKKGATFPQKTIYQNLMGSNLTWAHFYNDTCWLHFVEFFNTPAGQAGLRPYAEFYDKAEKGTLPNFSFIWPRQGRNTTTGEGSNDDHPCHDVALGERLLKDTYEALRAGPGWNKTLLLVTYDDAGGFYDHHDVPLGVPAPGDDTPSCPDKTDFTWLGVRVPTMLISPWVPKGKVIHSPKGPQPNSQYEHSSVSATLKELFDLPEFLTQRDAWAGSFLSELELAEPRTDTIMHTPEAPQPGAVTGVHGCATSSCQNPNVLTRRQQRRLRAWAELTGRPVPEKVTQDEAEEWIAARFHEYRRRILGLESNEEQIQI